MKILNHSLLYPTILLCLSFGIPNISLQAACLPGKTVADIAAPTNLKTTFIRKGLGEFGSPRKKGKAKHTGIDIIVRATYKNKEAYSVKALADGVIAYAQFNGKAYNEGFGNTIIIDHGNDCYTLMAHLASDPFTPMPDNPSKTLMVNVGQAVKKGELIGYFVDLTKGVESTGNAKKTAREARWQTHFEIIQKKSGIRVKKGSFRKKFGRKVSNPTMIFLNLGYKIE